MIEFKENIINNNNSSIKNNLIYHHLLIIISYQINKVEKVFKITNLYVFPHIHFLYIF